MMRPSNDLPAVYLCRDIVDFRKGINGLSILVEETLQRDPFSEQLFVFCNRRRDRVKILTFQKGGFVLWYKRLERGRFKPLQPALDPAARIVSREIKRQYRRKLICSGQIGLIFKSIEF